MGQCFGNKKSPKVSAIESHNHKQIELNLRKDQKYKKRVFFTGNQECIANIFCTIDSNQSIHHRIQNYTKLLISGYVRKSILEIPDDIQSILAEFYGNKLQFPNHYEFYPKLEMNRTHTKRKYRQPTPYPKVNNTLLTPTMSSTITTIDGDIQFPSIPVPSDTEEDKDSIETHIEYQINFPNIVNTELQQKQAAQLMITYHNLQCFKKKDYYLKWIHLLDNSLSVIFVADLSHITSFDDDKLLLKDMERFRRLMFYSNGKYDSRMPILVLSGIDRFHQALSKQNYRNKFETQFPSFQFIKTNQSSYYEQALKHIKRQYVMIFDDNLRKGISHWTKKKRLTAQKLFIRTINDINDINEVQRVWIKLNKALIHGNIMHELRNGGIAL